MRKPLLALVALLAVAPALKSQDVPLVDPGAIVTTTVRPPAALTGTRDPVGRLTLAYAVETAGQVRFIGRRVGSFSWEEGEDIRLPVTLRVPDRAEAGERDLATVAFESLEGAAASVPVRVRVRAVHEIDVQLVGRSGAVERGQSVGFDYVLTNRGNAGDSVALTVETNLGEREDVVPGVIWLAPYQERHGGFELAVPPTERAGAELYVRLSARLAGVLETAHATVTVLPERGLFPDLVQIPSTIFLGSTLTTVDGGQETRPVVAFTGSGNLSRETQLLFSYRYMPRGGSVFAFRGLLSGPRVFVGLERPTWTAAVGDLNIRTSDLLGFQLQGRGLQAAWRTGPISMKGMAARPTGLDGSAIGGHVAAAELGFEAGAMRGGLVATSTERSDESGGPESAVRAALARVQFARGPHWLGMDAGPMDVANLRTSETEMGPAIDARYTYTGALAEADLVYRKLPDLLSDPRLPPSEMRATGTLRPTRTLSVSGTAYDEAVPPSLQFVGTRARGARAGMRWNESRWTVGLSGDARTVSGVIDETRQMGRLDATLRAGDFTFDGSLGLGTTRLGQASELAELYRIGGSWLAERGMVTFHVTVSDDILQPSSTLLDAYGLYRLNDVIELYGTATTFVVLESEGFAPRSISDGLTIQTGARFRLSPSRFLYAGIERFSAGGSDDANWRLSVGLQQGLPLPLPVRRPPAASGVVFEDLNGDGRRAASEPVLDGVMLRMGFEQTVTLSDGRFEFRDAQPAAIEVDHRSLGDLFVPIRPVRVPPGGEVEIGLYRSAGLVVQLFLDANGNEVWDATELPASGVSVALDGGDEPWVLATGPDGRVSLSSIAPGTYVIRVDAETLPARALPARVQSVEVRGGETREAHVPIPVRQISFSRFGDSPVSCDDTAVCDDD